MPATKEKLSSRASLSNAKVSDVERNRALAKACLGGDESAYAELFDAYSQRVYNFCLRYTCNADDAAEATQEAFCNFLSQLEKLDLDKVQVSGYLFAAARNAALDTVKEKGRMEPTEDVPEDSNETVELELDPERSILQGDQSAAVAVANSKLPERHRAVLAMRELEKMSYEQIGQALDMKGNAVAQLLSRARLRLRNEIRQETLMRPAEAEECSRALPLLSEKVDGIIRGEDKLWLESHLADCHSCSENLAGIEEAGVTYRGWLPVPVGIGFDQVAGASASTLGHYAAGKAASWTLRSKWGALSTTSKLSVAGSVVCAPLIAGVLLVPNSGAPVQEPAKQESVVASEATQPMVEFGDTATVVGPSLGATKKTTTEGTEKDAEDSNDDNEGTGESNSSEGTSSGSKESSKGSGSKNGSSDSPKGGSGESSESGDDSSVGVPGVGEGTPDAGSGSGSGSSPGGGGSGSETGPGDCDPSGVSESLPPCPTS